VALGQ
jgi:hypothetical protein